MRNLSPALLGAIHDECSDVIATFVLRIYGITAEPVRVVLADEAVVSNGQTYEPLDFDISLPDDDGKNLPSVNLVLDNVSQALSEAILSNAEPRTVELELILLDDPDYVEAGPWQFVTGAANVSDTTIVVELRYEDVLNEPFPSARMTPQNCPSLFGRASTYDPEVEPGVVWVDQPRDIYFRYNGAMELWAGGFLVWRITTSEFQTDFVFHGECPLVGAATTAPVEYGTWTRDERLLYVCVDNYRRMEIDILAKELRFATLDSTRAVVQNASVAYMKKRPGNTAFQAWNPAARTYVTAAQLDRDGFFSLAAGWLWK